MTQISECKIFKLKDSLYQHLTIGETACETFLTFSGNWHITISKLKFDKPFGKLSDEELFQYSTILRTEIVNFITNHHEALENQLCYYRTTI